MDYQIKEYASGVEVLLDGEVVKVCKTKDEAQRWINEQNKKLEEEESLKDLNDENTQAPQKEARIIMDFRKLARKDMRLKK